MADSFTELADSFTELVNRLIDDIIDYQKLFKDYKLAQDLFSNDSSNWDYLNKHEKKIKDSDYKKDEITYKIDSLYKESLNYNYYYYDCPLQVYINHFESRFSEFKGYYLDGELLDFLKREINIFNNPEKHKDLQKIPEDASNGFLPLVNYSEFKFKNNAKYEISKSKKIEYLSEKLKQFGLKVEFHQPDPIYDSFYNIETKIEPYYEIVQIEKNNQNSDNVVSTDLENQVLSNQKLKTDLSVPQLSLLFKMINDLKPKIFNTKSDADLFRFISANFQTKKSSDKGISINKLRNEFSSPELNAIEFWEKHLHTMLSILKKLK